MVFKRKHDLDRHRNSVHKQLKKFWCPYPDCDRSENYPGNARPFPRKDKLNSHITNIHQDVNASSSFPLPILPRPLGLTVSTGAGPLGVLGVPATPYVDASNFTHFVGIEAPSYANNNGFDALHGFDGFDRVSQRGAVSDFGHRGMTVGSQGLPDIGSSRNHTNFYDHESYVGHDSVHGNGCFNGYGNLSCDGSFDDYHSMNDYDFLAHSDGPENALYGAYPADVMGGVMALGVSSTIGATDETMKDFEPFQFSSAVDFGNTPDFKIEYFGSSTTAKSGNAANLSNTANTNDTRAFTNTSRFSNPTAFEPFDAGNRSAFIPNAGYNQFESSRGHGANNLHSSVNSLQDSDDGSDIDLDTLISLERRDMMTLFPNN